jgi:hypothetical protein
MIDTGFGRDMGYASDAEMIEALNAERERALSMLTPEARATFEALEREAERQFLLGSDG